MKTLLFDNSHDAGFTRLSARCESIKFSFYIPSRGYINVLLFSTFSRIHIIDVKFSTRAYPETFAMQVYIYIKRDITRIYMLRECSIREIE